jgi:hypothetical protein
MENMRWYSTRTMETRHGIPPEQWKPIYGIPPNNGNKKMVFYYNIRNKRWYS